MTGRATRLAGSAATLMVAALIAAAGPVDAQERQLWLASATPDGTIGDMASGPFGLSLAADGSAVAFSSMASTLAPGDTSTDPDVFVRRLPDGELVLASVDATGADLQGYATRPSLSADGRKVAFLLSPLANAWPVVYVKDLATGELAVASTAADGTPADERVDAPTLSADGTTVAFASRATNLHPLDTTDDVDLFVKDLETGEVELATVTAAGIKASPRFVPADSPSLSADGSRVAFATDAANLDPADTDERADVYVKDLGSGALVLASVTASGVPVGGSSASLSGDGSRVAFASSGYPGLHPDASTGIVVRDLSTGTSQLVSTTTEGAPADWSASNPSLSTDGRVVAWTTRATNLVPDMPPGVLEVYLKDLETGAVQAASGNRDPALLADQPSLSADGSRIAFLSTAALLPLDTNRWADVYVAQLVASPADRGCTITGTEGDDVLWGTPGDDVICGLGGNDVLWGKGGDDVLYGDGGRDLLYGGSGRDQVFGGEGGDWLFGHASGDVLDGGEGRDFCRGFHRVERVECELGQRRWSSGGG